MNGIIYLKVKIKSLAAEAKIIRQEESKARKHRLAASDDAHKAEFSNLRLGLMFHRKGVVRIEARATQLAYAFLRGRALSQVEPHTEKPVDWRKVRAMVERYGNKDAAATFDQWVKGEQAPLPVVAG